MIEGRDVVRTGSKQGSSRRLSAVLSVSAAALVLLALPLQFRPDADGFGGSIGFSELAAAVQWNEMPMPERAAAIAQSHDRPFRIDTIDIPLAAEDGDLEYKLQMREGDAIVYSWRVLEIENPEWFYTEFHGHTEPVDGAGDLMYYRRETGDEDSGHFVAPFEGIHGWYLQNQSTEPVIVRLQVAGFYDLIPDQVPPLPPAE